MPIEYMPVAGNHRSFSANTKSRRRQIQNVGALAATRVASVLARSRTEKRRTPASMPPTKPTPMAMAAAATVRITVFQIRLERISATGI